MTDTTEKVERAIARFERVTRQLDERDGPTRDAARRERQRLNAGLGRTAGRVALTVGLIWLAIVAVGLFRPIGMFGFLGAVLLTGIAAAVMLARSGRQAVSAPAPTADLPNGVMIERFNSYLYRARRALPAPAQAELDAIAHVLPSLKQTLERVETLDPAAQDARRLMSIHLPGLIDRYVRVPRPIARSRMAKARQWTNAWSRDWRPAAARSRKCRISWHARTLRHWKPRAVSSSRATAKSASTARASLYLFVAHCGSAAHDNVELMAVGADTDAACLAQC